MRVSVQKIKKEYAPVNSDFAYPVPTSLTTVLGFGHTEDGGKPSTVLMEAEVFYLQSFLCQGAYPGMVDPTVMLCANADGKDRYVKCQN